MNKFLPQNPLFIGLTGGIASGKSLVAEILHQFGAAVISADLIGKEVMEKDPQMLAWVHQNFGSECFDDHRKLKRQKLGDIIFSDPVKKKSLDDKIFPLIYNRIKKSMTARGRKSAVVVIDAAMIFEWGIETNFDLIVTVISDAKYVLERLSKRDGFNLTQSLNRINSQFPPEQKALKSHYVIENNGDLEDLKQKVEIFWREKVEPLIPDVHINRKGLTA
jgi:dephospho-CoA kinase